MIRKMLVVAAAVAMPASMIAVASGVAGAGTPKPPPTNPDNDTLTCAAVSGSAKFSPGLTLTGTITSPELATMKLAFAGCTDPNVPNVTFSGKGKGVLTAASNDAINLLGAQPVSGTIAVKWKATDDTVGVKPPKFTDVVTTITVNTIEGAEATDGYAALGTDAGDTSSTGAFSGTDGGTSGTLYAESTITTAALTTELAPTPPPKKAPVLKKMGLTNANPGETDAGAFFG